MNIFLYFIFVLLTGSLLMPILTGFSATITDYHEPTLAWLITATLSVLGLILNDYALRRSHKKFMLFFAGGLLLRMIVLGIAIVILYSWIQNRVLIFALSFGTFLILFQTAEIIYLLRVHREQKKK